MTISNLCMSSSTDLLHELIREQSVRVENRFRSVVLPNCLVHRMLREKVLDLLDQDRSKLSGQSFMENIEGLSSVQRSRLEWLLQASAELIVTSRKNVVIDVSDQSCSYSRSTKGLRMRSKGSTSGISLAD